MSRESWLFDMPVTLPKRPGFQTNQHIFGSVDKIKAGWEAEFELGEILPNKDFANIQLRATRRFVGSSLEEVRQLLTSWMRQSIAEEISCSSSDVKLGGFDWRKFGFLP